MRRRNKKTPAPIVLQCPCCDYVTFAEWAANDICPVCFWENDGTGADLQNFDQPSAANKNLTLAEARANFERIGACDPEWIYKVCSKEERKQFECRSRRQEFAI